MQGEQEEYGREGIAWSYIDFVDNQVGWAGWGAVVLRVQWGGVWGLGCLYRTVLPAFAGVPWGDGLVAAHGGSRTRADLYSKACRALTSNGGGHWPQDCLDLLEGVNGQLGVFPLIDEACRLPRATYKVR